MQAHIDHGFLLDFAGVPVAHIDHGFLWDFAGVPVAHMCSRRSSWWAPLPVYMMSGQTNRGTRQSIPGVP